MRSILRLAIATLLLAPILPFEANAQCSPRNKITGTWRSDDQGTYIVRRIDNNVIWWMGQSADDGKTWANMFRGMFDGKKTIRGSWVDIKGWRNPQDGQGTLVLRARRYNYVSQRLQKSGRHRDTVQWHALVLQMQRLRACTPAS